MGILFTGDSYFQSSAAKLPAANGLKTVCFWMHTLDTSRTPQSMFNAVNTSLSTGYQIGLRDGALSVWGFNGGVFVQAAATQQRAHFAYSFGANTHRLHLNGARVASSTTAAQTGQPQLCQIGSNQWAEYSANTTLEDIRVYDRDLSDAELSTIAGSNSRDNIYNGLVAHWPCFGGLLDQAVTAANFIEYYGTVSTLVGTTTPRFANTLTLKR